MLGLVIAMLACLMRLFQLIFLHAKMLTFYVSGCTNNPEHHLQAAFYRAGLHFSLHGWQEHQYLKVEQLTQVPVEGYSAETYYRYVENGSKNYQGRFSEAGPQNKIVCANASVDSPRCPVCVFDLYLSKLPCNSVAFYLQPLARVLTLLRKPWYKVTPVGVNPLKGMVPKISSLAGLKVRFTNHSLRATAASCLFGGGVPEKIVVESTGHNSLKSLRQYERTTCRQLQAAGLAIAMMEPFKTDVPNCDEGRVEKEAGKAAVIGAVPVLSTSTLAEAVLLSGIKVLLFSYCTVCVILSIRYHPYCTVRIIP